MKRLVAIILFVPLLSAQSLVMTGPNGTQKAGTTVSVSVGLSGSVGAPIAALQFSITGASGITATVGPAATAASKQLTCVQGPTAYNCLLVGLNQNDFADGQIAMLNIALSRTTGTGTATVSMSGSLGATDGKAAPVTGATVTAASPFTFATTSLCDLNSDGKVDVGDLNLIVPQIDGGAACTSGDLDGDGKCTAVDGMIVVVSALGGTCQAK